ASRKSALANDRELAVFIGGSRWLIEAVSPDASSIWEGQWRVGTKEDRGYQVDYLCIDPHTPHLARTDPSLEDLHTQLREALKAIRDFGEANQLDQFTPSFRGALDELKSDEPLISAWASRENPIGDFAHTTLLPLTARQLLGAVAQAMIVFGGMSSWNDQS